MAFDVTGDPNNPLKLAGQIQVDYAPYGVAVSPDSERVFVVTGIRDWSNQNIPVFNYVVMVLDSSIQPAGSPIPIGFMPFGVAVAPDGSRIYVVGGGREHSCFGVRAVGCYRRRHV